MHSKTISAAPRLAALGLAGVVLTAALVTEVAQAGTPQQRTQEEGGMVASRSVLRAAPAARPSVARRTTSKRYRGRRRAVIAPTALSGNAITSFQIMNAEGSTRIVLVGTKPFTPKIETLKGRGPATVITAEGIWGADRAGYQRVGRNGVSNVRYGQFNAGLVRVVANTLGALTHSVQGSSDRTRWEVVVWAPGQAAQAVPATPPAPLAKRPTAPVTLTPRGEPTFGTSTPATPPVLATVAPRPVVLAFGGQKTAAAASSQGGGPYPALLKTPMPRKEPLVVAAAAPIRLGSGATAQATVPAPSGTASAAVLQDPNARRVTIDVVAADINDVLKALSKQSGINIVTGNDVKGNITVTLNRVSLIEALDMVTRLSGYTYAKFGSAYVVGSPSSVGSLTATRPSGPVETTTEFIPYRYNTPATLYQALQERFPGLKLPEADKTDTGVRQRNLVVTETPERIAELRSFIEKLEQVSTLPAVGATTDVYRIKYASPTDLITILARLVPTVTIQLGPGQGFIPNSTGGSVSFSTTPINASGSGGGSSAGSQSPGGSGGSGGSGGGQGGAAGAGAGGTSTANQANTLLMTGAPADIARARELLMQIDTRVPQIVFEAQVVDIAETDLTRLGFTYDFTRAVNLGEANTISPTVGGGAAPPGGRENNFGTILRNPYSVGIQADAVNRNNRGRVLAKPNLSALDGQPATVFIGDQIKYVVLIQQTPTGQIIQTETATVGITLKVTGKTSPEGTITLYVHPEVSTITSFLTPTGSNISLPQIATRFVDTTVRVKDGETIAIGGLIREGDIRNVQKVPFLGDLPFFGQFFRRTERTKENSNVVVFITSRILKD